MRKKLVVTITACMQCPSCMKRYGVIQRACYHKNSPLDNVIDLPGDIPDWCPLESMEDKK